MSTNGTDSYDALLKLGRPRKYADLIEAIGLLREGDPPLRWRIEEGWKVGVVSNLPRIYFPNVSFWTRFWNNEFWIVRLTPGKEKSKDDGRAAD